MQLELWIDVVCPWCYLGKRRLEAALEQFDARDELTLVTRAFELDPDAPPVREGTLAEMLAGKYGISVDEAETRQGQLVELGRDHGIDFRFDLARSGNTFDAHRLIHLAREQGVAGEVVERLMLGYFTQGLAIGDPAELAGAVAEAGLPQPEAQELLDGDDFAEEVRAEEQAAGRLGIRGVPFLVLDGRYGLSGAQPVDAYLQALEHAWGERQAA
ncbi:DsbA family oxidoreductase [Conexibacter sp. JD483]|uniref:DsbA family oxidoreductase n=1 Tax=unclassified Conexibacter TaxID=2627773 RepID=UPI00271F0AA2|nr:MULTISPECIES: DsbA family oxidoreductase [unclassified Conexibacter]MDO8185416.1 DsbA family oxidoreductase [Conexibacter sp. CPCC 205706]MDO8198408.1 DsbA family oxidoreductase [Conexibacter sp. CPCC 205762]MDR9369370.1 DsbA family oxidoreductase [Conexibacter sp. JD483]